MELCGRIWCALERLAQLCDLTDNPGEATLLLTAETLRLELLVIMDSCKSASWAVMLLASERRNLCSMLSDVLGAIAVSSDELKRSHIEYAQDRVFDEVLAAIADLRHSPTDGGPRAINSMTSVNSPTYFPPPHLITFYLSPNLHSDAVTAQRGNSNAKAQTRKERP
jgi:hypothetical protein